MQAFLPQITSAHAHKQRTHELATPRRHHWRHDEAPQLRASAGFFFKSVAHFLLLVSGLDHLLHRLDEWLPLPTLPAGLLAQQDAPRIAALDDFSVGIQQDDDGLVIRRRRRHWQPGLAPPPAAVPHGRHERQLSSGPPQ